MHGSRHQSVEAGVAPPASTPNDYWGTLASQPLISRLCRVWHPGSQEGVLSPGDTEGVPQTYKLWLWCCLGTLGSLLQRLAGKTSHHPIRNPRPWEAGGGAAAVAWQAQGMRHVELRWPVMVALATPWPSCDWGGQAKQPKSEQHIVTRDSDSAGIRVWEKPLGKPLRPAEVIEWIMEEGDGGYQLWLRSHLQCHGL